MKITIKKRNRIVEEYLWCIDRVIRQNWHLIEAAHLDRDDVYQDLAIRLIRAVAGYDPQKGKLEQHILSQLRYELLNCKSAQKRYGFKDAPYDLRGVVISLDALADGDPDWEIHIAAWVEGHYEATGKSRAGLRPAAGVADAAL